MKIKQKQSDKGQVQSGIETGLADKGQKQSDMAIELVDKKLIEQVKKKGGFGGFKDGGLIRRSRLVIDEALSRAIGKPKGVYLTMESDIVKKGRTDKYGALSGAIAKGLKEMCGESSDRVNSGGGDCNSKGVKGERVNSGCVCKSEKGGGKGMDGKGDSKGRGKGSLKTVLVVGLGNPALAADSLGVQVLKNLMVTRHFGEKDIKNVGFKTSLCGISPNVSGITGIESFDIVKGVVDRIKPDLVVVVDSLASASVGRIGSAFQLCLGGITPGSGVGNSRVRLDFDSLGVRVISVGVPLVVYASTIVDEVLGSDRVNSERVNGGGGGYGSDMMNGDRLNSGGFGSNMVNGVGRGGRGENSNESGSGGIKNKNYRISDEIASLIVTPKTIDLLAVECGKIIAEAINQAFV
ncbi:MAG: GPR endopeptidase [Firmicutes bacterium]|nr:GPR endopeptidase [Bacillota bacterium]